MDKKGAFKKLEGLSIEEKIAMLSETEEAYVRGFIEGAILDEQNQRQNKEGTSPGKIRLESKR